MQEPIHDFPNVYEMSKLPDELWEHILSQISKEDRARFVLTFLQLNWTFYHHALDRNSVRKILLADLLEEYVDRPFRIFFQATQEDNNFDFSEFNQMLLPILERTGGGDTIKAIFGKILKESADIFEVLNDSTTSERWRNLIPQEAQDEKSGRLLSMLENTNLFFLTFCTLSLYSAEKLEIEPQTAVRGIGSILYGLLNREDVQRYIPLFLPPDLTLYVDALRQDLFNFTDPESPFMSLPCNELVNTLKIPKVMDMKPYALFIGILLHLSLFREEPVLTRDILLLEKNKALQLKPLMNRFEQGGMSILSGIAIAGLYGIFTKSGIEMFLEIAILSMCSYMLYKFHQKIDERKIVRETNLKMAEKIEKLMPTVPITSELGVQINVPRLSFFNQVITKSSKESEFRSDLSFNG